jgi:hypothetical protein
VRGKGLDWMGRGISGVRGGTTRMKRKEGDEEEEFGVEGRDEMG